MKFRSFGAEMILLFLCFGLISSGCGLSKNSERAAQNSEKAAENSHDLLDLNESAYGDARQGGTRDRREKALENMRSGVALPSKQASAAAYFSALEFQLFKSTGFREDDESKRNRLFSEAIAEVLKVQSDFPKPSLVQPDVITADEFTLRKALSTPGNLDAFAFASSLHKISERQLEAAKRYGFTAKSVLDLFSDALTLKSEVEASSEVLKAQPAYVYEVLRESEDVISLLELRVNLLIGTALQKIGNDFMFKTTAGGFGVKATSVRLQDAGDRLNAAVTAQEILSRAGVKARYFRDVHVGLQALNSALSKMPVSILQDEWIPKMDQLKKIDQLTTKLLDR
jgi:hypothetical protein